MTGFKDGASSEGFGSDSDDAGDDVDDTDPVTDGLETTTSSIDTDVNRDGGDRQQDDDSEMVSAPTDGELPWIYQRNSITDGREKTVQLHLLSDSIDHQRQAQSDVESELGESVKKADLREAALLVGFQHIDKVADQLREWGDDLE